MEMLENKKGRLSNENTLLKQEVESLKTGADFGSKYFEEVKRDLEDMRSIDAIEEGINLIKKKHRQLEEKNFELKDRSRANNLRFRGLIETAEGAETWDESGNLIRKVIVENIGMESKETTERTHRAGSKKAVRKEMLLQSC